MAPQPKECPARLDHGDDAAESRDLSLMIDMLEHVGSR